MGNIRNVVSQRDGVILHGLFDEDRKVFRFFLIQEWYEADTIGAIWKYWEQVKDKDLV